VFNRLEQVNHSIVAGANVLECLLHFHVTRARCRDDRKAHTASRMAKPAKTAFAGGNGYRIIRQRDGNINQLLPTYRADNLGLCSQRRHTELTRRAAANP